MHELEESVNILLKDVDVVETFGQGRANLAKNPASFGLQLAEQMFYSHRIGVVRVVVEIRCAANLPDFEAKLSTGQVEHM